MKKFILPFVLILLVSCSKNNKNSIKLGVEQSIKIPVQTVSVSADIRIRGLDAQSVEKEGYEKLSGAIGFLKKLGYEKDQLEINSGEINNQSYRKKNKYQYNSSVNFDISDLSKIDPIRKALIDKGINSFKITSYKNSNEDSLYNHAYSQAIDKARKKAQRLLKNQDRKVGKIMNLGENVKKTIKIGYSKRINAKQKQMVVTGYGSVKPLFHKKYYIRKIEFTIEFALE